jgi:hypothetical protein
MNERMRFNPAEAASAGEADARSLLHELEELFDDPDGVCSAGLLSDAMAEIIGLAAENRMEECTARLRAFCAIVGPALYRPAKISKEPPTQHDAVESKRGEL